MGDEQIRDDDPVRDEEDHDAGAGGRTGRRPAFTVIPKDPPPSLVAATPPTPPRCRARTGLRGGTTGPFDMTGVDLYAP